jgi:hypothetical protein
MTLIYVHEDSNPADSTEFVKLSNLIYSTKYNYLIVISGFKRKEFRGKLAIGITANFINWNTHEEARVEEISGVAFIFNQKFFKDLKDDTGIDLENIVYYKDETHYFVMTAKKQSLLQKGVLLRVTDPPYFPLHNFDFTWPGFLQGHLKINLCLDLNFFSILLTKPAFLVTGVKRILIPLQQPAIR